MKNQRVAVSTREKIIHAALACIEKQGLQAATIRSISKEAGVNIAAINYYFRSKDKLIDEALEYSIEVSFSDMVRDFLQNDKTSPYASLQTFLEEMLEGAVTFPGLMKAHLKKPFFQDDYEVPFMERFNRFFEIFLDKLKLQIPKDRQRDLKMSVVQMLSAIMFPALLPGFFGDFAPHLDLKDSKKRKKYVNHLLKRYAKNV